MLTSPTNFRYRGPRESGKLILQTTTSIGDLTFLTYTYDTMQSYYTTSIPPKFIELDTTYQSLIQRARVVAEFARREI